VAEIKKFVDGKHGVLEFGQDDRICRILRKACEKLKTLALCVLCALCGQSFSCPSTRGRSEFLAFFGVFDDPSSCEDLVAECVAEFPFLRGAGFSAAGE
jgi:hypothetical protein